MVIELTEISQSRLKTMEELNHSNAKKGHGLKWITLGKIWVNFKIT